MVSHANDEHGFGKAWDAATGECLDPNGTIGAYIVPGLVEVGRATGEARYLDCARRMLRFYLKRDLDRFACMAGALDTYCIDKETSGAVLLGAMRLYEAEPCEEWLTAAKKAGWYFCFWMYHFDTLNGPGSDFARYGYHTLGGTSVSAQHHHIDPWGALIVPELHRLYRLTGDAHW